MHKSSSRKWYGVQVPLQFILLNIQNIVLVVPKLHEMACYWVTPGDNVLGVENYSALYSVINIDYSCRGTD